MRSLNLEKEFEDLRIRTLLSGEYDSCNAIVTLHAGAGGTDSCDWANMLYRMYTRYAQSKGFQITVLDYQDGDITGLKGITFEVTGDNAYGYFQSERSAPSGAYFSVQFSRQEADIFCIL